MKNKKLKMSFSAMSILGTIFLGSTLLFSNSAYATFSMGISSSGTVDLGTIMPTPTSGALSSSGADNVLVTTNCSAGYNVYATGSSGGSTALLDSKHNNTIPTSANTISSPNLLATNTWGLNTNAAEAANGNYYGLPAYNVDISSISPIYTASSSLEPGTRSDIIPVYYGIKIDMNTIPGNYSTNVLYTAIMNDVCSKYTLKFDDNSATENNLTDQTIAFGNSVNLSTYSTEAMIKRTGYHLTGWKVKIGNTISTNTLPTNNNTIIDDGESSEVTLIAQWEVNTYNISYQIGSTDASNCTAASTLATYNQDVTLSSTKCTKTGYNQDGWSINANGSTKDYTLGQTLATPNFTTANNGTYTLYPHFTINSHTVTINKGSNVSTVSGAGSYNYNTTVSISATVSTTGYHFSSWTVNAPSGLNVADSTAASTSFKMPDADVTITANADPNTFTLNYDANGGTGTTASQTVSYGTNVTISSVGFTPAEDKVFQEWNTKADGNGVTYSVGQSVAPATLKSNISTVNGGSVTLYAVWKDKVLYFQAGDSCSKIAKGTTRILRDSRDEQDYPVYRFPDSNSPSDLAGYCFMKKNLSLGYVTGGSITRGADLVLDDVSSASAGTISVKVTSKWSTTNNSSNLQYGIGPQSGYEEYTSYSYYSFGAAQKVCPRGWTPLSLAQAKSISTLVGDNETGSGIAKSEPYNFVYSGQFYRGGWAVVGSEGLYWLANQYSSDYGYAFWVNSTRVRTMNVLKNYGRAVRCVAQ